MLSGGGTGGHIFPAVAIANKIKEFYPEAEILFVGALGRMEMEKVPASGYKIVGVPIAGLQRKLSLSNLKLPFLLFKSIRQTFKVIADFKPNAVVGTGGYASAPLLYAAGMKKVPYVIQEQNSFAGITNKLLAKKASKICTAYEGMEQFFPHEKIIMTGNPVRKAIEECSGLKQEGIAQFNLQPTLKTILVIGGSLGARTINQAMAAGLQTLVNNGVQVIWQTGKGFFEQAKQAATPFNGKVQVYDFIARMDLAYAAADLVVSRAGASSVSEICLAGLPSILVPSPNVAEDHQTKNAMALVKKNATVLVKDNEADAKLIQETLRVIADGTQLSTIANNAAAMAFKDSAGVIAKEVLKLAGF